MAIIQVQLTPYYVRRSELKEIQILEQKIVRLEGNLKLGKNWEPNYDKAWLCQNVI